MGVQAVAGPAFELGGIVAAEEMARARRYEGAALQHCRKDKLSEMGMRSRFKIVRFGEPFGLKELFKFSRVGFLTIQPGFGTDARFAVDPFCS